MLALASGTLWLTRDPTSPGGHGQTEAAPPAYPPILAPTSVSGAPSNPPSTVGSPTPQPQESTRTPAQPKPGTTSRPVARTTTAAPPPPASKPGFLPPNPPGRSITGSATAACRSGGWYLNVSASTVGFTDTRVIVHTKNQDGSWTGANLDGGPTRFSGPAPRPGDGSLPSSAASIAWFVWALDENEDEVSSNVFTTNRPACAG
ncbi:hypothetical protein GCM10027290_18320 [Micromonospora sonneratiae]